MCEVEGCNKQHHAKGFCLFHYNENRKAEKAAYMQEYEKSRQRPNRPTENLRTRSKTTNWTPERYIAFNYAQGGLCYICGESDFMRGINRRLASDHDHNTGAPRGLLCMRCNMHLSDDIDLMISMVRYLEVNSDVGRSI